MASLSSSTKLASTVSCSRLSLAGCPPPCALGSTVPSLLKRFNKFCTKLQLTRKRLASCGCDPCCWLCASITFWRRATEYAFIWLQLTFGSNPYFTQARTAVSQGCCSPHSALQYVVQKETLGRGKDEQ